MGKDNRAERRDREEYETVPEKFTRGKRKVWNDKYQYHRDMVDYDENGEYIYKPIPPCPQPGRHNRNK